jgi:hypothetical protein
VIALRLSRASSAAWFGAAVLVARVAVAQTGAAPELSPEAVQSVAQDPAIRVDNPATRQLVQGLLAEGVRQLRARAFDQALANFLEAYARFPSPKILLGIAATLQDMGRLADAANTYQRYLGDPASGAERGAEVLALLGKLDEQLTTLTVRVSPPGSELSIDAGPYIPVGGTLVTRVRPGLHLVRIRKDDRADELTLDGFDGERKEVALALEPAAPAPTPAGAPTPASAPERVDGWLITGTQYGTADATGRARTVRSRGDGHDVAAVVPRAEVVEHSDAIVEDEDIGSGVISALRIDGKGRGFAGGAGLAIAHGHLEFDAMVLKSDEVGGYLGARYRLLLGVLRPYVALGVPAFVFDHTEMGLDGSTDTTTKLAVGVRIAGGLEVRITAHLSIEGDLGYEHFFFVDDRFEADVFVPTLGVIGRL